MSNAPKLRFKEFTDDWKEKDIKSITSLLKDGSHGSHVEYPESKYILLSAKNIFDGKIHIYEDDRKISEADYNQIYKNYELKNGDIALTVVGTIGRTAIINNLTNVAFQRSVAFFRFDKNNSNFMYQIFNTLKFQKELDKRKVVSAQPGIYLGDLSKIKINFPLLQEQEKIANFLSSIDKNIELLSKKEELLKQYKKGVMNKIFNQEIRFKDKYNNEFPEWEDKKLEQILVEPKKEAISNPKEYELLTVQLHCKGIKRSGNFPNETRNGRPYYIRNKNELLIGRQNLHNGGLGIVDEQTDGLICSNAISSYIVKNDNINFIYLYISRKDYYKKIDDIIGGTGQKEISKSEFNKLKISIPCLEEQEKIANFLSAIDKKIELASTELNKSKEFKQSLLQQMFI